MEWKMLNVLLFCQGAFSSELQLNFHCDVNGCYTFLFKTLML